MKLRRECLLDDLDPGGILAIRVYVCVRKKAYFRLCLVIECVRFIQSMRCLRMSGQLMNAR